MKIIITESQEKSIKERVIFMLMDKQKLHQLEIDDRIYFVKNIGDEYAKIRFDKEDGWCGISYNLVSELSDLTSFQRSEVKNLIGSWVENTLQMEVTYNPERLVAFLRVVENTLQMEVTSNYGTAVKFKS
jgi:glycyl-tRNA synthetase alpha subunit